MFKKMLQVSVVLSWFNLVVAGIFVFFGLLFGLRLVGMVNALVPAVLLGSIILHSYAALQLRKSMLNPAIPLGSQTPVGIRFVGYIALLLAVLYGGSGLAMIQHTQEFIKQVQMPPEFKKVDLSGSLRGAAIFLILFSLSIMINVILNFRLLRWYSLSKSE
jgi:hypothetical protein